MIIFQNFNLINFEYLFSHFLMKTFISIVLCIAFLLQSALSTQQQSQNPNLIFYVKNPQPQHNYVEVSLKIQSKHQSLKNAIKTAASTLQHISDQTKNFCERFTNKKEECKDIFEIEKFQIEPKYKLIRRQPVFTGFIVTHLMTIQVKSTQKIGHLVDKILKNQGVTVNEFKWKVSQQRKTREEALEQGIKQADQLCQELELKFGKIISVKQVPASKTENQQNRQKEQKYYEQTEQQDDNEVKFKFEVECVPKSKTKKAQ